MSDKIRVGIVGLGANTRLRHVPGLRACSNVEIAAVSNRRPESTAAAAREFGIPHTHDRWEELVRSPNVDAVVIGTWPYLHCPITLAALEAGKHVLTEARMAMNADEARRMLEASESHPELVTQIVPSPFGLRGQPVMERLLDEGFLGELREVVVLGTNADFADPQKPIRWRQDASLSGINMLALGILHETLIRWTPDPQSVLAQVQTFTPMRPSASGEARTVGTPDSVQVLTQLPDGARGLYHLSGAIHFGPGMQIHLYGSQGTLKYEFTPGERLLAGRPDDSQLRELDLSGFAGDGWQVERDFIEAIRGGPPIRYTDFATGLRYMRFTEAVRQSAASGTSVTVDRR